MREPKTKAHTLIGPGPPKESCNGREIYLIRGWDRGQRYWSIGEDGILDLGDPSLGDTH